MEISDDLRCVFSAEVEERDDSYVIEVPKRELDLGTLRAGDVYRVAMVAGANSGEPNTASRSAGTDTTPRDGSEASPSTESRSAVSTDAGSTDAETDDDTSADAGRSDADPADNGGGSRSGGARTGEPEPPVERGDEVTVDIEGIGDQGDGIARVDRGYVIIVPDTEKGERVAIRVTSVKQNVAFAEVVDRIERQQYE